MLEIIGIKFFLLKKKKLVIVIGMTLWIFFYSYGTWTNKALLNMAIFHSYLKLSEGDGYNYISSNMLEYGLEYEIQYTLWLFNIAVNKWPIEIDGLPIHSMVIFHGYFK